MTVNVPTCLIKPATIEDWCGKTSKIVPHNAAMHSTEAHSKILAYLLLSTLLQIVVQDISAAEVSLSFHFGNSCCWQSPLHRLCLHMSHVISPKRKDTS